MGVQLRIGQADLQALEVLWMNSRPGHVAGSAVCVLAFLTDTCVFISASISRIVSATAPRKSASRMSWSPLMACKGESTDLGTE